ncbi:MAG: hypothetical protein HY914_10085 [Desulfomonile tiedjei]|nr:hypothetical protein [Desulfomonile tiedjei]
MTVKQLAEALEYADQRALVHLINRKQAEFQDMSCVLKLDTHEKSRSVRRDMMILNYDGIILASMLSDAPRAPEFRKFAISVLKPVMTQGYYLPAEAETALVQKLTGILEQQVDGRLSNLDDKLSALTNLVSQKMITSEPDISDWPTPAQRIAQLIVRRTPRPY